MRWPSGITPEDFLDLLTKPHDVTSTAHVSRLSDGKFLGTCPVLEGQVDVDAHEPVARKCGPTLLDVDGFFDGPSMNLQVQIRYSVDGYELPVFTGPVVRPPTREGERVTLECQDRAAIGMRGVPPDQFAGNQGGIGLIKKILTKKCGETEFAGFGRAGDLTEDPVTVGWEDNLRPWVQSLKLANAEDRHLFYTAAGACTLRRYPDDPAVDLEPLVTSEGPVEPPSEVVNRVKVVGKRPADHTAVEVLRNHPLSPSSLNVGGVNQYFTVEESDDKLDTAKKANARAKRLLRQHRNRMDETQTFNMVPFPGLDPFDRLDFGRLTVTALRWSFPLTSSGEMSFGLTRPLR